MSWLSTMPIPLWAQAGPPTVPNWLLWFYVWGEPAFSVPGYRGGLLTWTKVAGLFCLLGWTLTWIVAALKEPPEGRRGLGPIGVAALAGLVVGLVAALLGVLVATHRVHLPGHLAALPTGLGLLGGGLVLAWAEAKLWSILRRRGTRADRAVLVGIHLALALGFVVSFAIRSAGGNRASVLAGLIAGGRLGATYMGLVVLARVLALLLPELVAVRGRRIYAIAWHSWTEAFRRMWAPWVVIVVAVVVLAFATWFLQPPRPAELGRLYVGTLMLLGSLLLTLMIVILAPISLPNDVRQQTIFTVVSKPARRLELIWGRILGYMTLVTVLLLLFGAGSLFYLERQLGAAVAEARAQAEQARKDGNLDVARQRTEQAEQLLSRWSARVPVRGSLSFYDSRNKPRRRGIDVGLELPFRSFVEGATPARALWQFGARIPNPSNETKPLDRRVPVADLLRPGTIEWIQDRIDELADRALRARRRGQDPGLTTRESKNLADRIEADRVEIERLQKQLAELNRRERALRDSGTPEARAQAAALHSPSIPVEMTFTVYRTTKGELGEPVYASLTANNPRPGSTPHRDVFPIREYYMNKRTIPAALLVGSHGELVIEVRCLSPNQYLGMAEGDLYLLSAESKFWANYLRGLFGIWLQALILTAIGVFAGSFLSWPVALLVTIFFFIAGNAGFASLQQLALARELVGGGPFEALIRTLAHDNLMTELEPTPAVVVAKTMDSVVMPLMARLVYVVPNFAALDVSETVAGGFAVSWPQLLRLLLLAVAYAIPYSIAGYFILKNREVAA